MYDDLDTALLEISGSCDSCPSYGDLSILFDVLIGFLLNYIAAFLHDGSCKTSRMLKMVNKTTYLEVLIRCIGNCFDLLRCDVSHVNAHLKPPL